MSSFEPIITGPDWNRVTDAEWADVLAEIPLFAELPRRARRKLVRQSRFAEFAPGEAVILTGEPGDRFYVILGGEATVRARNGNRTLGHGDYFGEIALLDDERRSASVLASKDLHVLAVPRRAFLELVQQHADVASAILREHAARIRGLEQQPLPGLSL